MESISPTNQPTRPPVWQLVVRKPFDASGMSEFAFWLSLKTVGFLIGEHPADEEVQTTHCHILIEGLKVTTEGLRQTLIKCDISGASYSLMKKRKAKDGLPREDYQREFLAPYVLKGEAAYFKSSNYSQDDINKWISKWVNHKLPVFNQLMVAIPKKKPRTDYEKCEEILNVELAEFHNTADDQSVFNLKQMAFYNTPKNRTIIAEAIVKWGNRTRTALHPRKAKEYYGIVLQQACPEYYSKCIVDMINNEYRHSH